MPKIPIFRIWLDRFQLFLVGKLRSFPVFTLARYQRWKGALGRLFLHLQKNQPLASTFVQTRRYIHGLTYTSFKTRIILTIFSLRHSLAPSLLCTSYDFTQNLFCWYLSCLRSTGFRTMSPSAQPYMAENPFLISFVRHRLTKNSFFASPSWEKELWGGFLCKLYQNQCVLICSGSIWSKGGGKSAGSYL